MTKTIRLWTTAQDGSEQTRDFASLSEAREAIPADAADWVIFRLPVQSQLPESARGLVVLDSI
jgi:hypothetical protein